MSAFNPGDTVVLKSGGPKMTVDQVGVDGFDKPAVWCDWFEGAKKMSDSFPPSSLRRED
jgi:uncharacterized protein YodC (DUF2158 family)